MSKEWFHGRGVDDERQEEPGLPPWLWLLLFVAALACCAGCTTTFSGICAVKAIGQDENGIDYFAYSCKPDQ